MNRRPIIATILLALSCFVMGFTVDGLRQQFIQNRASNQNLADMLTRFGAPQHTVAHIDGRVQGYTIALQWLDEQGQTTEAIRQRALDRAAYYRGIADVFGEIAVFVTPDALANSTATPSPSHP